ncbi:DUF1456 family protein [Myxococcota bacterium]|nr:DUF1456 family protein [Myxococcota bacterium]MBU1431887.1 DUF1456 family protein [Myxococcota bacterium]MBU1896961.1 DUF1456 family protein [Myxococcota bacterium]
MLNNDVLRSLRYSLSLSDAEVARLVALGGRDLTVEAVSARALREEEAGAIFCEDETLEAFLDGLILDRRGPRKGAPPPPETLTNNLILKKLRVALSLREEDLLSAMEAGGLSMSRGEISAFFRQPSHRSYRGCGNQALRGLLKGLATQRAPR